MYLVLDQGGQSSRAALFSESGELVQLHRQPVGTTHPKKGWVEQSPEEILHSLRHCLAQITDPCAIERAALVTQRSSFVCWHRGSGKALTPVISWQDTRGSAILAAINPDIRQVRAKTGLFPNSHFGASKMTWCIQQCSQVVQAQDQGQLCIGPIATFLLQRLTREGRFLVDPGNAQRTMLYNMESGHWDAQLLEQFAVPQSALPAVVTKASEWGSLDLNGHRVPIELVSGDQNAAFVSLGQGCPETAVINAGTGAFIGVPLPEGDSAPQRLLQTVLPDGGFIAEGTVNGAGRALATMAEQLSCDLNNMAPLGLDDPLFLNGEGGLAAPYWQADFPSRFVGQGTNLQKLAAVQESIVFLLYRCFLESGKAGEHIKQLKVAGGLSNSQLFCQSLADLFQMPVIRPKITEATAAGAAMLLAGNINVTSQGSTFNLAHNDILAKRFSRWLNALEASLIP